MTILIESMRAARSSGLVQRTCFRRFDFFGVFSLLVNSLGFGVRARLLRLVVVGVWGLWVSACSRSSACLRISASLRALIAENLSVSVLSIGCWHCGLRSLVIVSSSESVLSSGCRHSGQYQSSFDWVSSYKVASVIPRWLMWNHASLPE